MGFSQIINKGGVVTSIDETGNKYNQLSVKSYSHYDATAQVTYWNCICDCGVECKVRGSSLRLGRAKSCGCLSKAALELRNKHNQSYSREYSIWASMLQRCTNPKNTHFDYYGGLGIKVLDGWDQSFEKFFTDMGPAPEGTSLDRIDFKGNYCTENCRWAYKSMQQFNQKIRNTNTSGKTGVSFMKSKGKWRARISVETKEIHLGLFDTFEEAVIARESAELKYYGFNKE